MNLQENVQLLSQCTDSLIEALNTAIKQKGNKTYIKKYESARNEFHKTAKSTELMLHRYGKSNEEKRISDVLAFILNSNSKNSEILRLLGEFQKFLIDLDAVISSFNAPSFEIPSGIPMNVVRLDLAEAIKDYDNDCYLSSQVMCRRAYEGALREKFHEIESREPREDFLCLHCKKIINRNVNLSITKLHRWAIDNKIIHEKFQNIGLLIPELSSGAAHPMETPIPREKQIAKLTMEATFALLSQLYKKNS